MNTNMTRFRCFSENLCDIVLWTNVASALEGLKGCGVLESLPVLLKGYY